MRAFFSVVLFLAGFSTAQTGNLLNNADFSSLYNRRPTDWKTNIASFGDDAVVVLPAEGPNKECAIRLNLKKMVSFGQGGIRLVPGEKYKLGAYVRTKSFRCQRGGICIANFQWLSEVGYKEIPENTNGQWEKVECEITCQAPGANSFSHTSNIYSFQIFAVGSEGTLDICAPFLLPMSHAAEQNSARARAFSSLRQVIPISPLLDHVPAKNAEFEFYWPHDAEAQISASVIRAAPTVHGKLENHRCKLTFPSIVEGTQTLTISLTPPHGEQEKIASDYLIKVIPAFSPTPGKALNNLVTELFNQPADNGIFEFALAEGKWLFVSLDQGKALLDGQNLAFEAHQGRQESMLRLEPGRHVLEITEADNGRLIVRIMPETFASAFCPVARGNYKEGGYDYAFLKKHLSPSVNTYAFENTWNPTDKNILSAIEDLRQSGRMLIGNGGFHASKWHDAAAMRNNLESYRYISKYGGRAIDELSGGSDFAMLSAYADTLWMCRRFPYLVYTWLHGAGVMLDPHNHLNLLAAQSNASRSKGKFLCEAYIRTLATLDEQLEELHSYRKIVSDVKQFYPDYNKRLLMVSGGYQLPGSYMRAYFPQSDPKYSQDLFFQMCATDPVFMGLYGIGMYSYTSSDEENLRWYGALFRHYAIEGNKTLLSEKHGFRFNPGHLDNCDFESGLDSWQCSGPVQAGSMKDYGVYQGRSWSWQRGSVNDNVAILEAGNGTVARLWQSAKRLEPGKYYSLAYISADRKEVEAKLAKPAADTLLELGLDGVEIMEIQKIHKQQNRKAFVFHKSIFKALQPEAKVSFTAIPPESGQRQVLLNYVALRPYFME